MSLTEDSINVGDWSLRLLDTGRFALDGGAMFGSVPRVLWEKKISPDEQHRIPLALRLLLMEHASGSPLVLVDTGMGNKFDTRFAEMFCLAPPDVESPLEAALARAGKTPQEITDVVLTHLHFDHAGGISIQDGESLRPTFPAARHFLQRANWDTARAPNPRERASYLAANIDPLHDVDLSLLDGEEELFPGIRVIPSHGHTAGMQTVRIEGGGRVLHYLADLSPTQHHLHLPFTMGYDICAVRIMEERESLLRQAVDDEALVVFEHDAQRAWGEVTHDGRKFGLKN